MAELLQLLACLSHRDKPQVGLLRGVVNAKAEDVAVMVDEGTDVVLGIGGMKAAGDSGGVKVEGAEVLVSLGEAKFSTADVEFGGSEGAARIVSRLDCLFEVLEAALGDGAAQAGVVVFGMVGDLGVVAQVPEVGMVEGESERVAIAPDHDAEGAVAEREAVAPLGGSFVMGELVP